MYETLTTEQLQAGADFMTMYAVEAGEPRPVDANLGWDLLTIHADRKSEWDERSYDEILEAIIADVAGWRHL